jgi:hypothetical protein
MIIPTRWRDVTAGSRVIDPAGQVFYVLPRVVPFLVQLRAVRGDLTVTLPIPNPDTYVPRLLEPIDIAISNLSQAFTLEFIQER